MSRTTPTKRKSLLAACATAAFMAVSLTAGTAAAGGPLTYSDAGDHIVITGCAGGVGSCPDPLVIPDTIEDLPVTEIGDTAFSNATFAAITLPSTLLRIGDQSFEQAGSLTSIDIPEGVTYIGQDAFHKASSLTTVTLPSTLIELKGEAFYEDRKLSSISLPDGLWSLGDGAFAATSALASITIPDSITGIAPYTFAGSGISSVTLPSTLTSIAEGAFQGMSNLTSITIPASVTGLGNNAFRYNGNLANVYFQGDAPALGGSVFKSAAVGATANLSTTSLTGYGFNGDLFGGLIVSGGLDPDIIAPVAPVLSGVPTAPTIDTTASIGISGEDGATFKCSLDGADYAVCPSPLVLSGLALGDHTLLVTQADTAGNVSPAASAVWTVRSSQTSAPRLLAAVGMKVNLKTKVTTLTLKASADTGVGPNQVNRVEFWNHTNRPAANAVQKAQNIRSYATTVTLRPGQVAFWVRVKDTKGKWSGWYRTRSKPGLGW